jgi:hypothetical protein
VNLNGVPDRTTNEVRRLVEAEMRKMANPGVVEGLQTFLVDPRVEIRDWDWGQTAAKFPVWIVAESSRYDYGIAFSDYGFAPDHAWGLVFLSRSNFDADYCWFPSLEDAYKDSRLLEEHEERQVGNAQRNTA